MGSAATFIATSAMGSSISCPAPVRSRCSSAASTANAPWMPAIGSMLLRTSASPPAAPVIQAMPETCSVVCRESAAVAPRAVEPERGHAEQDDVGVACDQVLVLEAHVAEDAGREVLDHHVGVLDQSEQEVAPDELREVDGERPLPGIGGMERGPELHPVRFGGRLHRGEAHAVRTRRRLDLEDVGAEGGEQVGGGRAGPEHGEVEHGDPVEAAGFHARRAPAPRQGDAPRHGEAPRQVGPGPSGCRPRVRARRRPEAQARSRSGTGSAAGGSPRGSRRTRLVRRSGPSRTPSARCRRARRERGTVRRARRSRPRRAPRARAARRSTPARGCGHGPPWS